MCVCVCVDVNRSGLPNSEFQQKIVADPVRGLTGEKKKDQPKTAARRKAKISPKEDKKKIQNNTVH